jgi:hypothetical protein
MHKKGARVEWTDRGQPTKYGTVVKGGVKVSVIQDGDLKHEVRGPAGAFQPSTQPLPQDEPSVMDKYTVKKYKELRGEETRCFECEVHGPNGIVLYARNSGTGGSDSFWPGKQGMNMKSPEYLAFFDDAKAWVTQFGYPDMSEPAEWWLEWYQHERPYGKLAKDSISEFKAQMEQYRR